MAESLQRNLISTFLKSRDAWEKVRDKISDSVFEGSPYTLKLVELIDEFYKKDEHASRVNASILLEQVEIRTKNPKHVDTLSTLIKELDAAEVSENNVVDLALELKRSEIGHKLGMAIMNGNDKEAQAALMQEYQDLLEMQTFEEAEEEEEYSNVSVVQVVSQVVNPDALLKFAPKALNEALGGGALPGHHLTFAARPECFDPSTEVLTVSGWKSVATVTQEDQIAAVDEHRNVVFEKPAAVTVRDDFSSAFRFFNKKGQVDSVVSPGHRVVYQKDGEWLEDTAQKVVLKYGHKLHTSGYSTGKVEFTMMDALAVAYQADGRTRVYEAHGYSGEGYGYEINVKKPRKVERLLSILHNLGVPFKTWTTTRGHTGFYFRLQNRLTKDFSHIEVGKISRRYAELFTDELKFWDGSVRTETRWKYSNTNKAAVDVAQSIAALCGYNTFLSEVPDKRGYPPCYELHIRSNYTPVDGGSVLKEEIPYSGKMYCFKVSTGMLLVRRNGKVLISGNTGKTAKMCTLMHGFALQEQHGIYFGNEDPIMSVMQRTMSAITGMSKAEISANPDKAQELLSKRNWDKLRFIPINPGTLWEIEKYVKRYRPKWFIVDQMRNMSIKAGTKTEGLEQIAIGLRNIGKRYNCVAISITQAGDSASNKLVLEMGDIDSSNTGIPAACDAMVMIGVNAEYERQGMRMISLPKNKLGGTHSHFPVKLRADISRYESV